MKKKHSSGPVPPGNQPHSGPKFDRTKGTGYEKDGLEKEGEREQGDRQDARDAHRHPAPRHSPN
jgi:hypothetical protein